MMDSCRDHWLILQAAAEGYRQHMRRLESKQVTLDALTVTVSIGLIGVLWGVKELIPPGDYQALVSTIANVIGTAISLALLCLVFLSWRQEWRGRIDRQRFLAGEAEKLAARFLELFQADAIEAGKVARAKQDYRAFVAEESQPLGDMPQWARQRGFQHVGQRHRVQNIKCNDCDRHWNELSPLRRAWWRRWLRGKCVTCGVPR